MPRYFDDEVNRWVECAVVWSGELHRSDEATYALLDGAAWRQKESPQVAKTKERGQYADKRDVTGKANSASATGQRYRGQKITAMKKGLPCCRFCRRPFTARQMEDGLTECRKDTGCKRRSILRARAGLPPREKQLPDYIRTGHCRGCMEEFPLKMLTEKLLLCPTCKYGGVRAIGRTA